MSVLNREISEGNENSERLPEGWAAPPSTKLFDLVRGVSYASGEVKSTAENGYLPLIRANNIGSSLNFDNLQYVPKRRISEEQKLQAGDVVVAMSSGSKSLVGKAAQLGTAWDGTFGAFCGVLRPSASIDERYFGWFFHTDYYRNSISDASAGTNINNIKREYFDKIKLPLPPLAEQHRIVAKIESIMPRLKAARERLAQARRRVERFRKSVLAAACSGRLTEDWRTQNPPTETGLQLLQRILAERRVCWSANSRRGKYVEPSVPDRIKLEDWPEGWCLCSIDHVAEFQGGNAFISSDFSKSGRYQVLRIGNVKEGYLALDANPVFVSETVASKAGNYRLSKGDIVISLTGTKSH